MYKYFNFRKVKAWSAANLLTFLKMYFCSVQDFNVTTPRLLVS